MKLQSFLPFLIIVLVFLGLLLIPWKRVSWGDVSIKPSKTITVQGMAKMQVTNQVAMFSAGVNSVKDNRDQAIEEVNSKVQAMITALKAEGIPESDIKTQNLNIYQNEETYYEDGRQKTRLGQWRVGNTVEIKINDITKANMITSLLTEAGANNVWGPNYSLDDTEQQDNEMLQKAVEHAREKAQGLADSSGKKLGELLTISEGIGQSSMPLFGREQGGGGAALEPGSGTVQKFVTVTFELQ